VGGAGGRHLYEPGQLVWCPGRIVTSSFRGLPQLHRCGNPESMVGCQLFKAGFRVRPAMTPQAAPE
jgi:hypothetical protein